MEMQNGGQDIAAPLFCDKIITSGWTMEFKVSIQLHCSVLLDADKKIIIPVMCLLQVQKYHSGAINIPPYFIKLSPMDGFGSLRCL